MAGGGSDEFDDKIRPSSYATISRGRDSPRYLRRPERRTEMHRDIVRWIAVAVAVPLCLCGAALGQDEDEDAVVRRIEERLVGEGTPADEVPERLVQVAKEELGPRAARPVGRLQKEWKRRPRRQGSRETRWPGSHPVLRACQ